MASLPRRGAWPSTARTLVESASACQLQSMSCCADPHAGTGAAGVASSVQQFVSGSSGVGKLGGDIVSVPLPLLWTKVTDKRPLNSIHPFYSAVSGRSVARGLRVSSAGNKPPLLQLQFCRASRG